MRGRRARTGREGGSSGRTIVSAAVSAAVSASRLSFMVLSSSCVCFFRPVQLIMSRSDELGFRPGADRKRGL